MSAQGLTEQHQEKIIAFKVVCQSDDCTALFYLLTHDWSMRRATDQYYDDGCRTKTAADVSMLMKQRSTQASPDEEQKARECAIVFKPTPFGSHMQVAISQLFATKELSDVVLVLPSARIPAHRIVLASRSPVLATALASLEDGAKELRLDDEKDEEAFHAVLSYMYTGKASVATDRVLTVLSVAHRYGVNELKEECGIYLFNHRDQQKHTGAPAASAKGKEKDDEPIGGEAEDSAMEVDEEDQGVSRLLQLAQTYQCHELEKLCAEHLAYNFSTLCDTGKLNALPLSTFIELLKSDRVAALEEEIFAAVIAYVKFHKETQGQDEAALLNQLLPYVRFPFIQSQQLVEDVERNPLVAKLELANELLYEAYRYNFYRRLYNKDLLKSQQDPKQAPSAAGEVGSFLDFAKKAATTTTRESKFVFTSPIPHFELRCRPRSGTVKWNVAKKSRDLTLSNCLLTATHKGTSSVWVSAVADIPFSEHVSSVYVRIDRNDSNWIFIGVVQENWADYADSSGNYVGLSGTSWSHGSASGYGKTHGGVNSGYGVKFVTGDVIGVHLDMETSVLSFSRNGHNHGPAFTAVPSTQPLFVAVTLYHHDDQVTLLQRRPKGLPTTTEEATATSQSVVVDDDDPNEDLGMGLFG